MEKSFTPVASGGSGTAGVTSPSRSTAQHKLAGSDRVALVTMMVLWGMSWPAMKACLAEMPPLWLATLRFASAAACLFLILAIKGTLRLPSKADLPIVVSMGWLQMMAFTALGVFAMQKVGAGHAALLAYTTPLWVTVISAFLPGKVQRSQLIAVGLGVLGIAVICIPDLYTAMQHREVGGKASGDAMLLLAAVCWAIVIVHVRHHRWTSLPLALAPWQMLAAAVPLLLAALIVDGLPKFRWTPEIIGLLAFIGPVATCVCFIISAEVGRRIPAVTMALATLGVPVVGLLTSMVFLHEALSVNLLIGLLLIALSLSGVLRSR